MGFERVLYGFVMVVDGCSGLRRSVTREWRDCHGSLI